MNQFNLKTLVSIYLSKNSLFGRTYNEIYSSLKDYYRGDL